MDVKRLSPDLSVMGQLVPSVVVAAAQRASER